MKSFLIKTLLFTSILITGAFMLNYAIDRGLKKTEWEYFQSWNNILESKIHSDIIIAGNSRARVHFNPAVLDSVLNCNSYNIGFDAYPFSIQSAVFKIFEKYNQTPRVIIQNVDLYFFEQANVPINREQYLPYMNESLLKPELQAMGFTDYDYCIPALKYYSEYKAIGLGLCEFSKIRHLSTPQYKGYTGEELIWNGSVLEKLMSNNDSIVAAKDPNIIQRFDSFLEYCKINHIQVILVFSPQYIKATEFTKGREEVMNIFRSFSKKYEIPFLDYSNDPLCYDTTYFANAMHMNKEGSELFSLKLANDIKHLSNHSNLFIIK